MAITRADITGALKLIHANDLMDRKRHLVKMLTKEHTTKDVNKVLADLESYPDWEARRDLDAPPKSTKRPLKTP